MKLNCVIIDDEYLAIKILEEYISAIKSLHIASTFTRPQEALAYLQCHRVDLLFLDIQMPRLDGFELVKQLPEPPLIIFTTARHDYAVKAFDLDVIDYLVKPVPQERFEKAVKKAQEYIQFKRKDIPLTETSDYLMIKADYRIHTIKLDDIEYIEGLSEYVKIHTPEKTFIPLAALKELAHQLPESRFIRIHKSYIVALGQITSYTSQSVHLKSNKELPIGRSYKPEFITRMEKQPYPR